MNISYPMTRRVDVAAVESPEQRHAVGRLVGQRYAWRGYDCPPPPEHDVTFRATDSHDGAAIGTITVGLDDGRLKAEDTFPAEVGGLRRAGRKLCEFTRLAVDPERGGEDVIAALFHAAYLYAHEQHGCEMVLLEVNPRHVRYYQRALGAHQLAGERTNGRVKAPAVLLGIELEQIRDRLRRAPAAASGRSLYARALPPHAQQELLHRLQHLHFGSRAAAAAA